MEQRFDRASTVSSAEPLTTPRKIEGRFDCAHRPERVEGWKNRAMNLASQYSIVVRQAQTSAELSRMPHPEPFENLTVPRSIEGEDRGAV